MHVALSPVSVLGRDDDLELKVEFLGDLGEEVHAVTDVLRVALLVLDHLVRGGVPLFVQPRDRLHHAHSVCSFGNGNTSRSDVSSFKKNTGRLNMSWDYIVFAKVLEALNDGGAKEMSTKLK